MEEGETTIEGVVAPVFHKYVPPPAAVSVVVVPEQNVVPEEEETFAVGIAFTVTFTDAVSSHSPFDTITV